MTRDIRVALVGFGNVGRRLAEQLRGPYARALRLEGARVRVTGIATARHGVAIRTGATLAGIEEEAGKNHLPASPWRQRLSRRSSRFLSDVRWQ